MKGNSLTDRQSKVLALIREHVKQRGSPPSRAELAKELGFANPSGVDGHLNALARKGWIEMHRGVDRGIRLLREGAPLFDAEELGEVSAGNPIVADERARSPRLDDYDSVTARFEAKPDLYLRVSGDSMDRVGFVTGDVIAVQCEREPVNGEVVVARLRNEVTLKRFWRRDANTIELQPESSNPEHQTLRVGPDTEDFQIVGVVVGAIIGSRRTEDPHEAAQAA